MRSGTLWLANRGSYAGDESRARLSWPSDVGLIVCMHILVLVHSGFGQDVESWI
jgi:hypothetical protein